MNVKMLETVKWFGQVYTKSEVRVLDDTTGTTFCNHGWAEDVSGEVETKPRDIHASTLQVNDIVQQVGIQNLNI